MLNYDDILFMKAIISSSGDGGLTQEQKEILDKWYINEGMLTAKEPVDIQEIITGNRTIQMGDQIGITDVSNTLGYWLRRFPGEMRSLVYSCFDKTGMKRMPSAAIVEAETNIVLYEGCHDTNTSSTFVFDMTTPIAAVGNKIGLKVARLPSADIVLTVTDSVHDTVIRKIKIPHTFFADKPLGDFVFFDDFAALGLYENETVHITVQTSGADVGVIRGEVFGGVFCPALAWVVQPFKLHELALDSDNEELRRIINCIAEPKSPYEEVAVKNLSAIPIFVELRDAGTDEILINGPIPPNVTMDTGIFVDYYCALYTFADSKRGEELCKTSVQKTYLGKTEYVYDGAGIKTTKAKTQYKTRVADTNAILWGKADGLPLDDRGVALVINRDQSLSDVITTVANVIGVDMPEDMPTCVVLEYYGDQAEIYWGEEKTPDIVNAGDCPSRAFFASDGVCKFRMHTKFGNETFYYPLMPGKTIDYWCEGGNSHDEVPHYGVYISRIKDTEMPDYKLTNVSNVVGKYAAITKDYKTFFEKSGIYRCFNMTENLPPNYKPGDNDSYAEVYVTDHQDNFAIIKTIDIRTGVEWKLIKEGGAWQPWAPGNGNSGEWAPKEINLPAGDNIQILQDEYYRPSFMTNSILFDRRPDYDKTTTQKVEIEYTGTYVFKVSSSGTPVHASIKSVTFGEHALTLNSSKTLELQKGYYNFTVTATGTQWSTDGGDTWKNGSYPPVYADAALASPAKINLFDDEGRIAEKFITKEDVPVVKQARIVCRNDGTILHVEDPFRLFKSVKVAVENTYNNCIADFEGMLVSRDIYTVSVVQEWMGNSPSTEASSFTRAFAKTQTGFKFRVNANPDIMTTAIVSL